MAESPLVGVAWKFGEGVPAQVSSLSSDHGSKLRGPSQNSPRVASKRDVNIAKLNKTTHEEGNDRKNLKLQTFVLEEFKDITQTIAEKKWILPLSYCEQ
ncbi:hypothetical protein AVEN_232543-1 [Araneus ventricosus]|uniref:Uncharacterized protein n=1 Tax=Araneus ventricosus TaxID=182803 RepID=A0A4Y2LRK9_ARAVE|nr:hypothetical protein AVEN_229718-1 [Araneus ventricosus]GBN17455.1 hypothetical protein AVEN_232543-1 [Araneus ventricosus]